MAEKVLEEHKFDSDGDVILVLQEWHPAIPEEAKMETDGPRGVLATDGEIYGDCYILVHSKVLTAVSPVFRAMLTGNFGEGVLLRSVGGIIIRLPEDNLDAMLILINLLYGRAIPDPLEFDEEVVTEIALLVDKYDIERRYLRIADFWINAIKPYLLSDYEPAKTRTRNGFWGRDHQRQTYWRIAISWVLGRPEEFKTATQIAIWNCQQGMDYIGDAEEEPWISFLHASVLDSIFESRRKAISGIIPVIERYQKRLQRSNREHRGYRREHECCEAANCDLLLLGGFTRTLGATAQLRYGHWSFGQMRAHILNNSSMDYRKHPEFCETHFRPIFGYGGQKCGNRGTIEQLVKDIDNLVQGLDLDRIVVPNPRTGR